MNTARTSRRYVLPLLLAMACVFTVNHASAQPDLRPLGENIADKGSAWYRFESRTFDSQDGKRHYRVWLGIPKMAAPSSGYPVLYMLDGNAAMAQLTENQLKQLRNGSSPVLVAVGYDSNLPFDVLARSYDYTPPDDAPDPIVDMPHGRKGGGSHPFRQLMLNSIVPWVEAQAASDPHQRGLWGHSYGGLFVLDTFYQAAWFSHYFAAAPSLGWNDQRIIELARRADPGPLKRLSLYLMESDGVTERRAGHSDDLQQEEAELIPILRQTDATLHLTHYTGQNHGQILSSSLADTLKIISGSKD